MAIRIFLKIFWCRYHVHHFTDHLLYLVYRHSKPFKMATPSLAEKLDKIKSPGLQSQQRVGFS